MSMTSAPRFALFAVERHLGGGDGREDDVIDFERHFADQFDAVLDAGADAVDDVEIRLDGFAEKADGRGRVLEAVEPVVADDRVEIDVVLRDVDIAGDGAGFLDVFRGDDRFAIRQAEGAAVVDALDVGSGDGEKHAADFHIAGVLRLGERVLEAGAGLRVIVDFALADAGAFVSPMPRILTALSALTSPTTRQVLLVPISSPTWIFVRRAMGWETEGVSCG
jgi:hypothetical protein